MNEITKIHLGRQAFTIAVNAHKELQTYLYAIKRRAGGNDVVEEVELRMAELLLERGVHGDKVILLEDVEYLKGQLGEPDAFGDEATEDGESTDDPSVPKRLFRDTQNGMLAGVCAGIAKYLGTDPVWVRLIFVALVLLGASGILLYIVLWLIVPEAKTHSERLQMQGKPVNVDTIKEVVERADVVGAAKRAQNSVGKVVHSGLKVFLAVVGITLMIGAIGALLGLTTFSVYWGLNPEFVPGDIFPVGASEIVLIVMGFLFVALLVGFLLVGGIALVKRRWPLPGWGLGAMIAIWLASLAVGGALIADTVPKVRDRYEKSQHTYQFEVPHFTKLHLSGNFPASVAYEESSTPGIWLRYWGDLDLRKLDTKVEDGTLSVNGSSLTDSMRCKTLCIFHPPLLEVIIRGPKLQEITNETAYTSFTIANIHDQTLAVWSRGGSVSLSRVDSLTVSVEQKSDGGWIFIFNGQSPNASLMQDVSIFQDAVSINAETIDARLSGQCEFSGQQNTSGTINVSSTLKSLTINGKAVGGPSGLIKLQEQPGMSAEKCVYLDSFYGQPKEYWGEPATNDSL